MNSLRRILLFPCAALLAALFAACAVVSPSITPFYAPPDPMPAGVPGEIIRTEKLDAPEGVNAWRVMYHSRDLHGQDHAVTGLFLAPSTPHPPEGFPLIAAAHGTQGLAQQCAPSLQPLNLPALSEYFSFPANALMPFVRAGYAVTATDYEGLGAPGKASYLVGAVESQNLFDSVRALRNFGEIPLSDQTFLWGHSQGGHTIAFAAQSAAELAPDIPITGIVMQAPAAELKQLGDLALANNTPGALTGIAAMVAASWGDTYDLPLSDVLTPKGVESVPTLFQQCVALAVAAFAMQAPSTFYHTNLADVPVWAEVLQENTPRGVMYPAPVYVAQGESDTIIVPQTTADFVSQLCAAGNTLQYKTYPNTDHLQLIPNANADVLAWMNDRLHGKPAPSDCEPTVSATPPASAASPEHVILSDGDWTPDAAQIVELEARLPVFLTANQSKFHSAEPPIAERLPDYKIQYWGEVENGVRLIRVNALCTLLEGWQTQRIDVMDGGDCFFQLRYNPVTGEFSDLTVNGEA